MESKESSAAGDVFHEIILNDVENNPSCPHGPTLLFNRVSNGEEQKYYACSASRDRKDCRFYLKFDQKWTEKKQKTWEEIKQQVLPSVNHDQLLKRLQNVTELPQADRCYCHTCNLLLLPDERNDHDFHDVTRNISNQQLSQPSELLKPLENSSKEAQYLFARTSTQVIVNMLRAAGIRSVLCVGTPRVHEFVRNSHSADMTSMLLDFDYRYHQFFKASEFAWFNAFNCHWFTGELGKSSTLKFMQQAKDNELALVTDPPFGGRVEPLVFTFKHLDKLYRDDNPDRSSPLPLMWIFPYFMERMITNSCPDMIMLDYKVDYDNHPLFQQGLKGRKYGSPVRIFTTITPSKLPLPEDEGYWYCDICEKWSSQENKHCYRCGSCTSKNGRTYMHCNKCGKCVKPTYQHCNTCKLCLLPDHKCGEVKLFLCFACHKPGHKKNECPLRMDSEDTKNANRKRVKTGSKKQNIKPLSRKREFQDESEESGTMQRDSFCKKRKCPVPLKGIRRKKTASK